MTLVTRASFNGQSELQSKRKIMILKKYVWKNAEDGKVMETTENQIPKAWKKAQLLGAKGQEVTDAQAKDWGLGTKAKAPKENKGK